MAMKHTVTDSDTHFVVDAITRNIVNQSSGKTYLMQYDHNSEKFTFEVPRKIENHDMSLCDVIQVHYENTSTGTSASMRKTYRGAKVIDKETVEIDEDIITFSWLVPETATMFAGTLKFQLKFICYDNEDEGIEGYKWHTNVNSDMSITAGLGYSENDMPPATTATLQSLEINDMGNGIEVILDGASYKLYNGDGTPPDDMESTNNKVTSIGETSTDTEYPSALAVYTAINSHLSTNGTLPTIGSGDNGKIIEVLNGAYVLKFTSESSFMKYLKTITVTEIDENSTDSQYVSAKAVYDLVNSKINTTVTEALNTEVEV